MSKKFKTLREQEWFCPPNTTVISFLEWWIDEHPEEKTNSNIIGIEKTSEKGGALIHFEDGKSKWCPLKALDISTLVVTPSKDDEETVKISTLEQVAAFAIELKDTFVELNHETREVMAEGFANLMNHILEIEKRINRMYNERA